MSEKMSTDNPVTQVIELLKANGHAAAAAEVETFAQELSSPDQSRREVAADALLARCDVRWLGDLFIAELDFAKWTRLLEKMAKFARKHKR